MKKITKKFLFIFILLFYSNNTYATTNGSYSVENTGISIVGKIVLFLIAIILIALVLFLSYKMDKNEMSNKRKEKIINNKKKNENLKSNPEIKEEVYKFDSLKNDYLEESETNNDVFEAEDIVDTDNLLDEYISDLEDITELDKIVENIKNDNTKDDIDHADIEDELTYHETLANEEIYNNIENEIEKNDEKEIYYNENTKNLDEFTMVFNSSSLKNKEKEDDEDDELEEIEEIIAKANIKKYTRNKKNNSIFNLAQKSKKYTSTNNSSKRYTRKKESKLIKKESKRYTRKKVNTKKKDNLEEKIPEKTESKKVTLKRGRPKKTDKPKRGQNTAKVQHGELTRRLSGLGHIMGIVDGLVGFEIQYPETLWRCAQCFYEVLPVCLGICHNSICLLQCFTINRSQQPGKE